MKSKTLLSFWLLLLCMIVGGASSAWAEDYTITFKTGSGDGTTASTSTACSTIVSAGSSYLSGNLATATKVYYSGSGGLKLGTSSATGVIKMNLAANVKPTSIVVKAKLYNADKAATIAVNEKTAKNVTSSFADYTFDDFDSEISYIQLNASKYLWVSSVTVNYTAAASTFSVTYDDNDATSGSVPEDDNEYEDGDEVTVLGNTGSLAKTGYTFGGWNTKTDGSGDTYSADDTFEITDDVTLYAKWNAKTAAGLAYETTSYNVFPGASFDTPTLTNPNSLDVSYSSSNTSVASVNSSTGAVSIGTTEGTATITASSAEDETYAAGSASYTITVAKGTTTVTLNYDELSFNIIDGTTQTLTGTPKYNSAAIDGAAVTWSVVSGSDYASVSDAGVVTALAPGSATIRASYAGTTLYAASYADCAVTVNKANTTLTLNEDEVEQDLKNGRTITLTPTVKALKSDDSEVTLVSPTVTWTSSDETVATVSGGVVTGLKDGTVTITASYAGDDNYNAATNATCSITFTDTRIGVSISTFTPDEATLVIGDTQETTITNDQAGWPAAYNYSSSNTSVATIDANGVITAVAKGTATITATIVIALDETGYKAGTTASKTLDITVTKPFHTATFWVNGDVTRTASVEEDQAITFPTAKDTPADASEFNKTIDGKTFMGWYTAAYSHASTAPTYVNTSTATMSTSNVTYYAVYADVEVGSYTLDYNGTGETISSQITTSYGKVVNYTAQDGSSWVVKAYKNAGMQINTGKNCSIKMPTCPGNIQSVAITCSAAKAVGVSSSDYSGSGIITYLAYGTDAKSQTIDLSSKTATTGYIVPKGGSTSITKIVVNYISASDFTTDNRSAAGIAFEDSEVDKKLTSGYTGQALSNPNSIDEITYSSSDATVATVNSSTGAVALLKAGSTTITATFAGNATYKPAEVSYTLNVTEKTPHGLAYATDEVEKLTTDAAFTNTLTNVYSLTVSYSSSDEDVATIDEDGEVTIKGAGSTTITASFAGDDDYEAGEASYTLTVSKAAPTLSFASDKATLREDEEFSGNELTNPASLTVNYSSNNTSVATVNASTGVPSFVAAGSTTITASFAGNDTYTSGSASYTLKVLATPTISVSDDDVAYGETFTVDDSGFAAGAVTVTSGNTSIATVDGLEITPVACGSVTITVSTAENETYKAGEATFTLTVTAPAGKTTAPSSDVTTTFDFSQNGWGLPTSSTTLSGEYTKGTLTVTISGTGYYFGSKALLLGKNGATITLPAFDKPVTQIDVSGAEGASTKVTQNIYVGSTAVSTETTSATSKKEYAIDSDYQSAGNIYTFKVTNDYNTQVSKIVVHQYQAPTATVTLNKYGYATYCSVNPIDFTSTTGYTAWRVSGIDGDAITFTKITEKIKGGQGVLLYNKNADRENTSNATIKFADGTTEFSSSENMLVGTTAPTYLTQTDGDYTNYAYSKGENAFMKVKDGSVIPANKAYLPVPNASEARFTFVFEDNTTTTVQGVTVRKDAPDTYYNLSGQRVENPKKGGIYIKNGKKVMMK